MANAAAAFQLVEAADPPVPSRTSPIEEPSIGEKVKDFAVSIGIGLGLSALSYWLLTHHIFLVIGISAGVIGLAFTAAAFFMSSKKSSCPYCGVRLDVIDCKQGKRVRCEKCNEYSTVNAGLLKPLDPTTTSETPEFESPVFRGGVLPNGCVACGAPPTRFDDISKASLGAAAAAFGLAQGVWGSVKGIPYCDKHRDKLALKVTGDKKMFFRWTSVRMMRKYLTANKGRQAC